MFEIQKITQRYNPQEDRIEMGIQNGHGEVIRLWLTRRLANRIITSTSDWLPKLRNQQDIRIEIKKATNKLDRETNLTKNDSQIDDNQTGNNRVSQKERPVDFDSSNEEGLLSKIDVKYEKKSFLLAFSWGLTGLATIRMGKNQLLTFIEGLIKLSVLANWDQKLSIDAENLKSPNDSDDFDESISSINISRTLH